jgi:energy-converting hydrogenase Eha subunit A
MRVSNLFVAGSARTLLLLIPRDETVRRTQLTGAEWAKTLFPTSLLAGGNSCMVRQLCGFYARQQSHFVSLVGDFWVSWLRDE